MNESKTNNSSVPGEELFLVHVPALIAVLLSNEKEKGRPLTEFEVLEITDNSNCIAMPGFAKQEIEESRGYLDIDPENVWAEWQIVRTELSR